LPDEDMMDPVNKALWLVETRLGREVTVDDVAAVAGLSRFHLSRVFALSVGQSIMRYARGRRLSEAARALAAGAPDILSVALDHGYSSHEAFTRAFRDQFGLTPEEVRARGATGHLALVEPIRMTATPSPDLKPRFENTPALVVAGISQRHARAGAPGIPLQWQKLVPHIGSIPGERAGGVTFGVCTNYDEEGGFDYLAGVEVAHTNDLPSGFTVLRLKPQRHAVFVHRGHVSAIAATWGAAWGQWLPASGLKPADAPMFERYDHRFNPMTGEGDCEVWLPVEG
jgi:AraC family transcriptional regulator